MIAKSRRQMSGVDDLSRRAAVSRDRSRLVAAYRGRAGLASTCPVGSRGRLHGGGREDTHLSVFAGTIFDFDFLDFAVFDFGKRAFVFFLNPKASSVAILICEEVIERFRR